MATENTSSASSEVQQLDALVVGAGFGGLLSLYHLRKLGLKVKVVEAKEDVAGTWRSNCYPGARCDVEVPFYSLDIPEVWQTWNWKERFVGYAELRAYFEHFTKVLDLRKDIQFHTEVVSAQWQDNTRRWLVESKQGEKWSCKYLVSCVGTAFKRNIPNFKNLDKYKGEVHHSSWWPAEDVDVEGKRVAIIGQGATGVQVTQEWGKKAGELKVFVRTPNVTLPMYQRDMSDHEQIVNKSIYKPLFDVCRTTATALPYEGPRKSFYDTTPEEREAWMENLWQRGGFTFSVGMWPETMVDEHVNNAVYDFWVRKTAPRVKDQKKRDLLVPNKPHFPFATKRMSLEQDYFEICDQDNVTLIDVNASPIEEFTETGLKTADGKLHEFEKLALCTGFDAIDGPLRQLGIKDRNGVHVGDKWSQGVRTHLGMFIEDMPNLFMIYGPQSPAAFTNGPVFIQQQVEWVARLVAYMEKSLIDSVEPTQDATQAWRDSILKVASGTLFPRARSWYNGSNVPGKKVETMTYLQGVHTYTKSLDEALAKLEATGTHSTSDFIVHSSEPSKEAGQQAITPV